MYDDINSESENKLTRQDYDKINESIIRKNPALGRLDERVIYDKEFLLEIQSHGYNPLDKEDVQNFLDKKPPKDLNRNLILCGAGKYDSLGQSEFAEIDLTRYMKETGLIPVQKKSEDVYLSDIPNKKTKDYLIEDNSVKDVEKSIQASKKVEVKESKHKESEDAFRKNIAKAFGSSEMNISHESPYGPPKYSSDIVQRDDRASKILELIKEYRALGFSPEEIKKEIQRFH